MTLVCLGPLYVGIDQESYWDAWRDPAAYLVHLGRLRLEWDCRPRYDGSTQKTAHQSADRATAQGH